MKQPDRARQLLYYFSFLDEKEKAMALACIRDCYKSHIKSRRPKSQGVTAAELLCDVQCKIPAVKAAADPEQPAKTRAAGAARKGSKSK